MTLNKLGLAFVVFSMVGCAEEAKPPGGVIDLELNVGPPSVGTLVMTSMTFLTETSAIERLHGSYRIPSGTCVDLQNAPPESSKTLDVGDTVEMVNGDTHLVFDRMTATDGSHSYWPRGSDGAQFTIDATLVPANTEWDVVLSGSTAVAPTTWSKSLMIPRLFEIIEPAGIIQDEGFTFSRGTPLPVKWNSFANLTDERDIIIEIFDKDLVTLAACRTADTGDFTVPAHIIDAVADNATLMAVRVHVYRNEVLNGAEVEVTGGTCNFGPMVLAE